MANMPHVPTSEEVSILQDLMDRKLHNVANGVRPRVTVQDIINNRVSSKFPYRQHDDVTYGVTLGGILFHRGTIADYVERRVRMADWDSTALLSYFCSNVDRERNFSLFFGQTRVRVAMYLSDMSKGRSTPLKEAYVLACLEAKGVATTMSEHRPLFIEVLQRRLWGFPAIGRRKVNRQLPKIYAESQKAARAWNERRTPPDDLEALRVFMELCSKDVTWNPVTRKFDGVRDDDLQPSRASQRLPRTNRRHGIGFAEPLPMNDEVDGPTSITQIDIVPKKKSISLDIGKFDQTLRQNPLFKGLVAKMPGWHPYEVIDIQFGDEVFDYEKMVIDYDDDDTDHDEVDDTLLTLTFNFGNMDVEGWLRKPQEDVEMGDDA